MAVSAIRCWPRRFRWNYAAHTFASDTRAHVRTNTFCVEKRTNEGRLSTRWYSGNEQTVRPACTKYNFRHSYSSGWMTRRCRPRRHTRSNAPTSLRRSHFLHSHRRPASKRNRWYSAWWTIECHVYKLRSGRHRSQGKWRAHWKRHIQSIGTEYPEIPSTHAHTHFTENSHTRRTIWCDARKCVCRRPVWCMHRTVWSSPAFSIAPRVCDGSCMICQRAHHSSHTRPYSLFAASTSIWSLRFVLVF